MVGLNYFRIQALGKKKRIVGVITPRPFKTKTVLLTLLKNNFF